MPQDDDGSTNLFGLETPIKAFVYQDETNQVYQGQVWAVNPFAIPLQAMVAQPVPAGVTVVSTDGSVGGGWIVWTNTIATNGVVDHLFSFRLSVLPGAGTNLLAPTVVFSDATGTNSLTMTAAAAGFSGLFPVGVSGVVPGGDVGRGYGGAVDSDEFYRRGSGGFAGYFSDRYQRDCGDQLLIIRVGGRLDGRQL
jgi:hypothetical protein